MLKHFIIVFACALSLLAACKSDNSPKQDASKTADNSLVVGKPTEVPKEGDINTASSTTDVRRFDNPYQQEGCTIFSDAAFKQVFGIEVSKEVNKQSIPGKGHCIWTWMKPNWKEIENANEKKGATYREFKNSMFLQVVNFGTPDGGIAQFKSVVETKKESYNQLITGIGDEAVWSEKDHILVVRKGHLIINLSVEVSEVPGENLAKAKAVAAGMAAN